MRDFRGIHHIFPHDFSFLRKKFPDAIEIVDSIRGFLYVIKEINPQTASGGQLSYEESLFRSPL